MKSRPSGLGPGEIISDADRASRETVWIGDNWAKREGKAAREHKRREEIRAQAEEHEEMADEADEQAADIIRQLGYTKGAEKAVGDE